MSASITSASELGVLATLRRGLQVSPALRKGLGITLVLAVLATGARLVVPIAVQVATDSGLLAPGGVDVATVVRTCLLAGLVLLLATAAQVLVNTRLFTATEAGLAQLRTAAFRRVHELSVLTQHTERRGSLVSRVTSDVDTISMFVQWGGIMLIISAVQIAAATVAMALYSWQLTAVVWVVFLPILLVAPRLQGRLTIAYGAVRLRVGAVLAAVSEAVVGAHTIRAYGTQERTRHKIDHAIDAFRHGSVRAQSIAAVAFSTGVLLSGLALAAVVVAGTFLGLAGSLSVGQLIAFLFLVQLFTGPVQNATEVLNELQNAVAGWRRVLALVETRADIEDPVTPSTLGARGPLPVDLEDVTFAYPGSQPALVEVGLHLPAGARIAVVGATGSGKTTLSRLVARFVDPTAGTVRLGGVDLRDVELAELRERVVVVTQEGFLFDATVGHNIGYGHRQATAHEVERAVAELGLADWLASLPSGLDTPVGQRGERLSAGERQLVALARAHLADADLLILDEATSAVDPATEVRIARALAAATRARTSITIAHRLATAEAADLVVVIGSGRVAAVGTHTELVTASPVYSSLFASWVSSTSG